MAAAAAAAAATAAEPGIIVAVAVAMIVAFLAWKAFLLLTGNDDPDWMNLGQK